jgi:uncharacterized protein YyaL (SSP411 family)
MPKRPFHKEPEGNTVSKNRLSLEKSPYLLQHAENPVNWYPWGKEAFEKAENEGKPVFLSIGYATCHWCHVMAHESFEDKEVARRLNKHYVSVKVDREERPDIDKIYMDVCQALTGKGGWPLSVILTPQGKPIFAGTYFPKTRRMGMPGFLDILEKMAERWQTDRTRLEASGDAVIQAIYPSKDKPLEDTAPLAPDEDFLKKGFVQLERAFDPAMGGFSSAPKFPTPHHVTFLLRWYARSKEKAALQMAEKTLTAMRHGGLFDHIGFGFHRYSVDDRWFAPHFEKMLYDQALLSMAYMEAYQTTRKALFAQVAKEIFTYVLRDMVAPDGGFCAAEDADSEGKEGLFYLWTPKEIRQCLGVEEGDRFCRFFGITEEGNFEHGRSIPHIRMPMEAFAKREALPPGDIEIFLESARKKLFTERQKRVHPLKDDKVLTSWNGLMIAALAKGYQIFGNEPYRNGAERAARFILKKLRQKDGRLLRRYRDGQAAYPAYLDDYVFLTWGLIELYAATFDVSYLETAISMTETMIDLFWDKRDGGFYFTGKGNETLVAQSKDVYDGALPSGNSIALLNFLRLSRMTGNQGFEAMAQKLFQAFAGKVRRHPIAYTQFLSGCDFLIGPSKEIVVSGDPGEAATKRMLEKVTKTYQPNTVLLFRPPGQEGKRLCKLVPFVEAMTPVDGKATAYVCEAFTCQTPTTDMGEFEKRLE